MKKFPLIFGIVITFFFYDSTYGQLEKIITPDFWANLEGTVGDKYLHLSVFLDQENDKLLGSYCTAKEEKKYLLEGHLTDDGGLELWTINSQLPKHHFIGNFWQDEKGFYFIKGIVTNTSSEIDIPFRVVHNQSSFGTAYRRYGEFQQTTEEVEAFMQLTKEAIVSDDKDFLAAHMSYPIRFKSEIGDLICNNPEEFLSNFSNIVTPELKEEIRNYHTHHLFSNHTGAMLGNGQVWISSYDSKTRNQGELKITSLHVSNIENDEVH